MIKERETFKIPQLNPGKDIEIDVNWQPDDEKTNECKVLRFRYPDGTTSYVKKDLFYGLLFAIGSKEQQRKMIPQKLSSVRHYKTDMYLQMRKDCKKGDIVKVPVDISLPSIDEEIIGTGYSNASDTNPNVLKKVEANVQQTIN